jgi:hypothetical protein
MKEQVLADAAQFERLRHWKAFRRESRNLFPTDDSFRWFLRQHEAALVTAGVFLKLPRGNFIDPEPFRAAAINLMRGLPVDPVSSKEVVGRVQRSGRQKAALLDITRGEAR